MGRSKVSGTIKNVVLKYFIYMLDAVEHLRGIERIFLGDTIQGQKKQFNIYKKNKIKIKNPYFTAL